MSEMTEMTDMARCQSCGMPLAKDEDYGTEKDGSKNEDYCAYCYKDGEFTVDITMDEMIALCAEHADEWDMTITKEDAIALMKDLFPTLKRWQA